MDGFSSGVDGAWSQEATAGAAGPAAGDGVEGEPPTVDAAFKLQVEEGATVSATFPFFGDPEGGQLRFQIGDHIKVLQKDELWSWGKLETTGEEGWFPHNYVQASFQPLPGMHELRQRILIKKAREEAIARGEDPDLAEAMILNGGEAPVQRAATVTAPEPAYEPPRSTGLEAGAGLNLSAQNWDWDSLGMGMAPAPAMMMEPPQPDGDGMNWGNQHVGGDPDFGMWMDDLGEDQSSVDQEDNESVASVTSSDRERRRRERKNIARELLDTEDKYVRMLEALLATIIRPCLGQGSSKASPLPRDDANELFGTLRAEEILAINTAFREQLRGRMATLSDETCFGDLFNRFAPFLKMYVEYCTQHENTASRVSLIAAKSDKFCNLLHRARSDPRCQDLDAQSLLIMPIQRIPRYKLLLEGMLKNTERDHPDRPLLQTAIEQISDVASFINDSIKRRENQAKIWDLQAMLTEPIDLAKPTRIFIRSGMLTKLGRRYQDRDDFFALFNDGLLHAKPATFGTKYVFKRIDAVLQVENVGFLKDKPKALHAFRVVTKGHIYLLSAKSAALKQDWMKVIELAIRGGKRETIHKGPLRVLQVGKDCGVRLEYFYVFSDVVVRGKALWRGKFKHKETMDVSRIESNFLMDARHEALLPKEVAQQIAYEQTFRIVHKHGNVIVMAKSDTDKALWISALEHQLEMKRNAHIGTVSASNRIVHEDNFADLQNDAVRPQASASGGRKTPVALRNSSSESASSSGARSPSAEQRRRVSAAATLGMGSVNGTGSGGGAGSLDRSSSSGRGQGSGHPRGRRRTTDGSPKSTGGPLATTSDLLISLESSDEEEDQPTPVNTARRSMPYVQQQSHTQSTPRRQTTEGHVSPPRDSGGGGGGVTSTALVPLNGNRGGGGGKSLLDKDLEAVFGAPPAPAARSSSSFQTRPQQDQSFPASTSYNPAAAGGSNFMTNGGMNMNGQGQQQQQQMVRNASAPAASSFSSTPMPLLQPPTRDTPTFRTAQTNGGAAVAGPSAMVLYGSRAQQQQPQAGPGAMVVHGAGQQGPVGAGFDPFQGQNQNRGQFARSQQPNAYGGQGGGGFGAGGGMQQEFAGMGRPQQQQQQQPVFSGGGGMQHPQNQQQFQPQAPIAFSEQFAPQQQQYHQQQQFQQGQQQMQQPQYPMQQQHPQQMQQGAHLRYSQNGAHRQQQFPGF